ncbi:MAG: TIGR04282 family arsenosugar biosynthesis glycosyltransferase [Planctomycetota bacterium]|jgi:rSAM/selenodomain-associated transferase 1
MTGEESTLIHVVMAKRPEPGRVNTRLIDGRRINAQVAAELAWAMLTCVVDRLTELGEVVLAVSPDGSGAALAESLGRPELATIDQGRGDLGMRLEHVWRSLSSDRPVAFFGMDSPDVPATHLASLVGGVGSADVLAGPTSDGGYWTIAASAFHPQVLREIDWGSGSVYDQTRQRAREAGLRFQSLPAWHDVDHPEDVAALAQRLDRQGRTESAGDGADQALRRLAARLHEILQIDRWSARGSTP